MREEIILSWNDWLASREAKRENLRRHGLAAPSRRTTDYGTSGLRLRRAFSGLRAPEIVEQSQTLNQTINR